MGTEKVTLDTCVLQEHWWDRARKDVVDDLLRRGARGDVDLAVIARIREDVPREPLAGKVNQLPELGVRETGSVTRVGYWILGRDQLGSEDFEEFRLQLESQRKEGEPKLPDWRDWDHLHAHMLQGRDVFLTWDKEILGLAPQLFQRFGLRIMTPERYSRDLKN